MTDNDVIAYLQRHPDLVAKYIDDFEKSSDIADATNRDEKIISLSDRQVPQLQQKIRLLENQINAFLENGRRNEKLWDSLLKTTLALLQITHENVSIKSIESTLREQLDIEHCRIFTVSRHTQQPNREEGAILNFLASIDGPKCFNEAPEQIQQLKDGDVLASSAYVPVSTDDLLGILIFSSSNIETYRPDMDTQFLGRIGSVVDIIIKQVDHHDLVA